MGTLVDGQNPLASVENLLNEFYHQSTSNARKHDIEVQLQEFQNTTNAWQMCIQHLSHFNNQFLWFFNVSTIELTISRKWGMLSEECRIQIRDSLWSTYVSYPLDIPVMQRDKSAQLIALIGKRQFPDEHPNFMNQIIELLKNKFILGVTLLRATSDELNNGRADITTERQKYLNYCVSMYLPSVFIVLDKFLVICVCRLWKTELRIIPNSLTEPNLNNSLPDDDRIGQATVDLLICIQQIFIWATLDDITTVEFFNNLFELAKWNDSYSDVSISAISTISELFYRQKALPLPIVIANGMMELLQQKNLKKSNELYQDKLTELLRLFTTQQWPKWVKDPKFPAVEYLAYLYQYTFYSYGALSFTERLAIWAPIIRSMDETGFGKHSDKIMALVSGTLKNMLFQYDQDMHLEVLDNEDLDDDMETELQHFLSQCIETIALVAEIAPTSVYDIVFIEFNKWEGPFEVFMSLMKTLPTDKKSLAIFNDQSKCHYLHCMLRDLSSLCQTIARICTILHGTAAKIDESISSLTFNLIYSIRLAAIKKFYSFDIPNRVLLCDFIETFAQILSALRCLLLKTDIQHKQQEMNIFIETIAQLLLPPSTCSGEPKIISIAAAQLLLSISSTLRPKYLIENRSIMQLVQNELHHLDTSVALDVQKMICNCFVLPWTGCSSQEQNYEERCVLLQEYIAFMARDLIRLDIDRTINFGQEAKVISITASVLYTLKQLLDYYHEHSSNVKQLLATAYKPVIEKTLTIYNTFSSKNIQLTEDIFDFCLSTIRTLQIQLGQVFLRNIILLFVEKTKNEQITMQRYKSLEKLLKMFLLVVEQPGNLSLIPDILNLSIDHILPLIYNGDDNKNEQYNCSDVTLSIFQLFDGILQHRWQYFYKSNVLKQFSQETIQNHMPEHADQLVSILNSYGRAIVCANDPHITRCVLQSLQVLNDRWKLYQKDFFKHNLLQNFEMAIIKTLLTPEGIMHYELLLMVLYNMGQIDVKMLHETFISIGYSAESKMVEHICLSTDLPTFSQHMNQLIQDTKCSQYAGQ